MRQPLFATFVRFRELVFRCSAIKQDAPVGEHRHVSHRTTWLRTDYRDTYVAGFILHSGAPGFNARRHLKACEAARDRLLIDRSPTLPGWLDAVYWQRCIKGA
jgi:hypothetical protein